MPRQLADQLHKAELNNPRFDVARDLTDHAADLSICYRCGGLLVVDHHIDLLDDQGNHWCRAMRCVQCGDIVDPVILKNRRLAKAGHRELAGVA